MNDFLTRAEHEEFARRLDEANARHSKRLSVVEEAVRQTNRIALSVQELATTMKSMLKEQEKQGSRLEALEGRDGIMWRSILGYALSALVGAGIAAIIK